MNKSKIAKSKIENILNSSLIPAPFSLKLSASILLICVLFSSPAQAREDDFIILEHADRAEFLEFSSEKGMVTFEGGVKADYKDIQLEADWIQVDIKKGFITARGNVIIRQPQGVLYGQEIVYDFAQEKIVAQRVRGQIEGFYVEGEGIEMEGEKKITIKEGTYTTCSYKPPHYKIKAARVVIYPQKSLWAYNVVPYIGKLPFFYFPVYYRSLSHKGPHLFISPGYSSRDGWYLRSKYRIYLEDDQLDVLLDYFQHRGFGKGVDYQYRFGGDGRGGASLYHISEKEVLHPVHTERWKISLSHYQTFFEDFALQGKIDYRSDELVDHDIESADYPRTQEIESYLALTQRKTNYILRLSGKREDTWDGEEFVKKLEEAPKISLWRRPLPIGPLYYQVKGYLVNQYPDADNEYELLADLEGRLFSQLNIGSPFTLSPEIGLREELNERTDLLLGLALQTRFSRIKSDLKYRLEKTAEEFDPELEEIRGLINLTLPRWCRVGVNTTYDLVDEEYEPLIGEVELFLPAGLRFELTSRYHIEEEVLKSFALSLNKDSQKWEGDLGAYFVKFDDEADNILDLESKIGFWLTPKTKVKIKGRYDTKNEEIEFWETSIYRDLHCWELKLGVRHQPVFTPTTGSETKGWVKMNLKEF